MDLGPFFEVFTANLTADDVARETRQDLSQMALNVVDVLRVTHQPTTAIRAELDRLLAQWEPALVKGYLSPHDYHWFTTPERQALLKELLGEIASALDRQ